MLDIQVTVRKMSIIVQEWMRQLHRTKEYHIENEKATMSIVNVVMHNGSNIRREWNADNRHECS